MAGFVKLSVFIGVLANFIGSIMLLRDFRDIAQIPFFRWRSKYLKTRALALVEKHAPPGLPVLTPLSGDIGRMGTKISYSFLAILRARPAFREIMVLVNNHNSLRAGLHLAPYRISDHETLNRGAVVRTFAEIDKTLEDWQREHDPEERTDRSRALWLFIVGFALLVLASLVDLITYMIDW
ncbi:hypothetical protein GNX14_17105 [Mesorhizobium japonicum]|uniref:hypothetical protein n=1 Tax=Mesorhizobium TaxID=68287 RepID=UPI0008004B8B|nr:MULTISPECIES: hypothetical protein [Mesorhizobium]MUT22902.1 hypothetical protein [Mesorhizobium japonicum]OBQ96956.1 hypothetical protein A9K66_00325 [Mesorhizobium sp. AA23]